MELSKEPQLKSLDVYRKSCFVLKVTFVNMTARCGSTLLGQMISRTPKAFVMSEPWAWMHLHGHYIGGDIPMAAYREGMPYPYN